MKFATKFKWALHCGGMSRSAQLLEQRKNFIRGELTDTLRKCDESLLFAQHDTDLATMREYLCLIYRNGQRKRTPIEGMTLAQIATAALCVTENRLPYCKKTPTAKPET